MNDQKTLVRILIVEDERIVAEDIKTSLQKMGYSIPAIVSSGSDSIEQAGKLRPELVLMDIVLEGSMSGIQAAERIRTQWNIPVVYLTSYAEQEILDQAKASQPYGYILKPFNDRELHSTIEMALQRYRVEQELKATREEFHNIVQKSTDGIMVLDRNGKILFANPAAGELFHRRAENLVGEVFGYPVVAGRTTELDFLRQDGKPGVAEMRAVKTRWAGQPAYLALLRDVTEHKRTLRELDCTRQQQLQMKNEFLSHVSHELRSPLTAIYEFITILLDGLAGGLNPEQGEYLGIVLRNAYQLRDMIDELLEATRAESGRLNLEPRRISLVTPLQNTIQAFQASVSARNIALVPELPDDLPFILADPRRVQQVLRNLIDNALKFTPEGGRISVRARIWDEDPNMVLVAVEDSGCGIDPQEKEKIFERLYQGKGSATFSRRGLGLGLYICRELVTMQGGHIWANSEPGRGSTFSFTLPVYSLERILIPILTPSNLARGSLALIGVRLSRTRPGESGPSERKLFRKVKEVIERCTLPDVDLLLPSPDYGRETMSQWVIACCDEKGARILTLRIRSQFDQQNDLRLAGIGLETFYRIIEYTPPRGKKEIKKALKTIVGRIEKQLDSAGWEGGDFDARRENPAGG